MTTQLENFVAPKTWAKYREVIMANLGSDDDRFMAVLSDIDRRNLCLNTSGVKKDASPRRRLIEFLDGARLGAFANNLPRVCWSIDENKEMLMRTALEWSTSSHRPGVTKIYVAARMFRSWSKFGADITSAVLAFLDSTTCEIARSKPDMYHLISELARSEHFSTPKYLQWTIARGGLYDPADVEPDGPCVTRLLAELPVHNISESMEDLRTTLLSRVDYPIENEERKLRATKLFVNRQLPGMQGHIDSDYDEDDMQDIETIEDYTHEISRTEKSDLGLWLRRKVKLQMVQPTIPPLDDWDDSPMKKGTSAISSSDFGIIRRYLELIDDYSMLADVLKIVSSSNDPEVLASCADTFDLHIETFAAIGAMKDLFDTLMSRLRALTAEADNVPRVFLVSLSDLASRIPDRKLVAQQLALELALSDRKTAADACSPVSDHMAILETAEANFTDEIEKVLASGNSMDQATLERLFQRIIMRLEASWKKSPEQQRSCSLLLTRLRTFDIQQFDVLMTTWTRRVFQLQARPTLLQVFGPLISFGCVALRDILNFDPAKDTTIAWEALDILLTTSGPSEVMSHDEAYRFNIKQAHVKKDYPREILTVVYTAFDKYTSDAASDTKALLTGTAMHDLLQEQSLSSPDTIIQHLVTPLLNGSNDEAISTIDGCIDKLLLAPNAHAAITTEILLEVADDLSLPFCQVKLASMFKSEDTAMEGTQESRSSRLEAFDAAIESAITSGSTAWASIVPLLDTSVAQHLRRRAESQFLALFPSPRMVNGDESRIQSAETLLHVIEATAYSIPTVASAAPSQTTLGPEIVSTLNGIWLLLSNTQSQELKDVIISKWLPLLLAFTTIHATTYEATKLGNEARAKTILSLSAIYLQLLAFDTSAEPIPSLASQTFDLALHLVDSLPEDMRLQCTRSLRDSVASQPKISYLFSISQNPTDWLMLSQKEKMPGVQPPVPGSGAAERERWERERERERLVGFTLRRWEMLGEPTPNVGENDTSLSLTLFGARRG